MNTIDRKTLKKGDYVVCANELTEFFAIARFHEISYCHNVYGAPCFTATLGGFKGEEKLVVYNGYSNELWWSITRMATNEEKAKLDASISKQGFTFDGEFYHRPDKRVLHLMVNNTCTNDCPLCCNKQYDVDDIPIVTVKELRSIDTICFTGGQPLLDLDSFGKFCTCLERNFPNIKTGYVYMNGAELYSYLNPDLPRTKKLFERFPWNSRVNYGLTMSPKCRRDWNAIREFKPFLDAWKSNRIYCFSDKDIANAESIFCPEEIEIIRREWQTNFVPAPNTFFRRLPIWIA